MPFQPDNMQDHWRWQYAKALELLQSHDQIFWLKNTAFILAHTIILGGVGNIVANSPGQNLPTIWIAGLALLGLLVGLLWWALFEYNHCFYELRMFQARELEEQHPGLIQLLTEGRLLSRGEPVEFSKETDHKKILCVAWTLRTFRGAGPVRAMIFLFILAYVFVLLWSVCKLVCCWISG